MPLHIATTSPEPPTAVLQLGEHYHSAASKVNDNTAFWHKALYADTKVSAGEPLITIKSLPYNLYGDTHLYKIGRRGDILLLMGKSAVGKSHVVATLITAALSPTVDALGFDVAPLNNGECVIIIDTEMSDEDAINRLQKISVRCGYEKRHRIPNLMYFNLSDLGWKESQCFLDKICTVVYEDTGLKTSMLFIDGSLDMVAGTRDESSTETYYKLLMKIAKENKTLVVPVMHMSDKALEANTPLGTVGSYLQRKCSVGLEVRYDKESHTHSIVPFKLRNGSRLGFPDINFEFDPILGVPVTANRSIAKAAPQQNNLKELLEEILGDGEMAAKELVMEIGVKLNCSERSANRKLSSALAEGLVIKEKHSYRLRIDDKIVTIESTEEIPF